MKKMKKITIAKGDGIGPEIMDATLDIILSAGAKIEIEEIPDSIPQPVIAEEKEEEIKEVVIPIVINADRTFKFSTSKINGKLLAIIIDTEKPLYQVLIYLKKYPDLSIFDSIDIYGTNYLPIRHMAISKDYETFRYSQEFWYLNDELGIEVIGEKDSVATITIRYE